MCLPVLQCLSSWDVLMVSRNNRVHPVTGAPCALPQATQLVGTMHSKPGNPTRNTLLGKTQFYILGHVQDASVLLVAQCSWFLHINFGKTSEKSLITGASQWVGQKSDLIVDCFFFCVENTVNKFASKIYSTIDVYYVGLGINVHLWYLLICCFYSYTYSVLLCRATTNRCIMNNVTSSRCGIIQRWLSAFFKWRTNDIVSSSSLC